MNAQTAIEAEADLARVMCRNPSLIVQFDPERVDDLMPSGYTRKIIGGMLALRSERRPITIQTVASTIGLDVSILKQFDDECTRQMLADWKENLDLIRGYGLKRKLDEFLRHHHEKLHRTKILNIEDFFDAMRSEFQELFKPSIELGPLDLDEIMNEYLAREEHETSWKIKTGFEWIDFKTEGGIEKNQLWVLYGQYKNGKTQVMRCILYQAAEFGAHVVQFAHDGGNRYKHMQYYWAMRAQKLLVDNGYRTSTKVLENGNWEDWNYITAYNCEAVIRGKPVRHQIPEYARKAIWQARNTLGSRETTFPSGGRLRIYDAKLIRHSLAKLETFLQMEMIMADGPFLFALDHAGELGDPSRNTIHERTEMGAQFYRHFTNENDCAGIVLSQINREGQIRGGDDLKIVADLAAGIKKLDENEDSSGIEFNISDGRFSDGGKGVKTIFTPYLHAGLVMEGEPPAERPSEEELAMLEEVHERDE